MNQNIQSLCEISNKPQKLIIGLMSGTSMDGLDVALCQFRSSGIETKVELLEFETIGFQAEIKDRLMELASKGFVDLKALTLMNAFLGDYYAEIVLQCLKKWGYHKQDIDLIASHGQTIYHVAGIYHLADESKNSELVRNATLQIGDGDHLALKTGIITLSDFRQKHIAAGGQGAPLVIYGDFLLFSSKKENRVMLNIGGISNFTFLPSDADFNKVFATDVGPGNILMDQYIQMTFPGKYYDKDAEIAKSGLINSRLLDELLKTPFLNEAFPKTTGPELFNLTLLEMAQKTSECEYLPSNDVLATLCHFTAHAIVNALKICFKPEVFPVIYFSGGGIHNPLLTNTLRAILPEAEFKSTSSLGFNPDAKEALLFALLANEAVSGNPETFKNQNGIPAVNIGKVSFPT